MADAQRKLLQELFSSANRPTLNFDDPSVCKNYLVGICPGQLFPNSKYADNCHKVHDDDLRKAYQEVEKKYDYGYERNLERDLETMIAKVEREVKRTYEKTDDESSLFIPYTSYPPGPVREEYGLKSLEIETKLKESERLAKLGEVNKAADLLKEVSALSDHVSELKKQLASSINYVNRNHQQLRVCDICGGMISLLDSEQRLLDHFHGRAHAGWEQARSKLKELRDNRKKLAARDPPPPKNSNSTASSAQDPSRIDVAGAPPSSSSGASDRQREWGRDHDRGYDDRRDRRDRDRDYDRRDRERERERDRDYRWGRDRDDRRDRDRDRDRRKRSRSPGLEQYISYDQYDI